MAREIRLIQADFQRQAFDILSDPVTDLRSFSIALEANDALKKLKQAVSTAIIISFLPKCLQLSKAMAQAMNTKSLQQAA